METAPVSVSPAGGLPSAQRRGTLFIVSGPSGVGKGTLVRGLVARDGDVRLSVSVTTRSPRPGEQEGVSYHFKTREAFDALARAGALLEHAQFGAHHYGTPREWVEAQQAAGHDVILEIDVKGAIQVRERSESVVLVFVLPPSFEELAARLQGRQSETPEVVRQRLEIAREELTFLPMYDYQIVNDDLEVATRQLQAILEAERCRVSRLALT
ncbi:MAG: guanylate kinase [Candidatus Sericytochromatia bacterium]|nr:guanylate kinase [Candidatus Sericytochromatia bacterium]